MTTLVPRGYGGFPSYQFSPPNQFTNRYFNGGYPRQGVSFAPHYPTRPLYQPPFNPVERSVAPYANQYREPGVTTQLIILFNELDAQYRQEQYLRQLQKMQKRYWKEQANNMPPPIYDSPVPVYQYEKETQYVPYPVYVGPGAGSYGAGRYFGNAPASNTTVALSGGMNLPPKIRVIFIPTGQSFSQQPYTGSLAMPPFLYNRISQPLCSFPLPPPLPQLGSLPLTPAVQQMVVQRYSNPIAVLPFTPNWQTPQMMMPGYPPVPQQQQPYISPISAVPALPPPPQIYIPPAPQTYIPPLPPLPSAPISAVPPAPQAYIPPAPQAYIPPAPQAYISPAPQAYIPPPPQAYIPPPPPPPPVISSPPSWQLPPPSWQLPPPPDANVGSSLPQYSYNGYPSICRACPPAPPPLGIPVTGHCWVQHCAACHHVPTPISNPNIRPGGGRITPLLRQPIVPQYIPEQTREQYFHTNAPVMMRPWLRKTPPIPPGAVIISDEIMDKNGSYSQYNHSQRQHRQYERGSRYKHRSTTVTSKTNPSTNLTAIKVNRSMSPRRINNNNDNPNQQQGFVKLKNPIPKASSSTSSSGLSSEYTKVTLHPPNSKPNVIPQPLTREARNINLQYKYQSEELPTVYLVNRYLKSNSETSTSSSNIETPSNHSSSSSFIKELSPISSSSSTDSNSIKNVLIFKKEDEKPPRPPSRSKKSKDKLIIIREFTTSSPSTISTISSNMTFSIIDKDEDSISTTSTLKTDYVEDDDIPRRNLF